MMQSWKVRLMIGIPLALMVILLIAWSIIGYLPTKDIEMPAYTVLRQAQGYEVREYAPYIRAEAVIQGGYRESLYGGFPVVADYIFGNNRSKSKIAMTSPVLSEEAAGKPEKIAMTSPVLHEAADASAYTIAFIMPSEYSMEELPVPGNAEVKLREVPGRKVAVLRFGGYATEKRAEKKKERLREALERDGIEAAGDAVVAQYNPPWTPPWMRRNEIWIEID